MIARTWQGRVAASKADEYYDYLQRTGVADYRATPGNRGVLVLRSIEGSTARYTIITFWDSIDAIREFAGEEYELARYYPEDDEFLLEREEHVGHAEVVMHTGLVDS